MFLSQTVQVGENTLSIAIGPVCIPVTKQYLEISSQKFGIEDRQLALGQRHLLLELAALSLDL
jgi:hypothetical protein